MNKEIVINNDTVVVLDENFNRQKREYSDNLNEILVTENIIEKLEKEKNERENNIINDKELKDMRIEESTMFKKIGIVMTILATIVIHFSAAIKNVSYHINIPMFDLQVASIFSISVYGAYSLIYHELKTIPKRLQAETEALKFINNELKHQKEYLSKLIKEKVKRENISDELKFEKVNDEERINEVNKKLELYYKCGYYYDKLLKLHDKDKLKEKISDYFEESEIEFAEKYIEEESKKLELKSTNS